MTDAQELLTQFVFGKIREQPQLVEIVWETDHWQFVFNLPKKKPYKKPELRIYGDIRGMTESNRVRGGRHDRGHGRLKTA